MTRLMIFVGALIASMAAHAQDKMMNIYLEPDINGTVYFQESMSDLNKLEPRPLLDGTGAGQGWMFVQFPGKYVGYVPAADVSGKSVRNGSKAFLRPDAASPVLAVILDGDEAQVSNVSGNWATVYFQGEAPAYFRMDSTGPASVAAVAPAATIGSVPSASQSTPAGSPPVLQEVKMQETAISAPVTAGIRPMSQSVARYVQGRFERISKWDSLFGSDYSYRLIDANDDTIAYVNVDDTIIFGKLESYFGEQVEIQGVLKRIKGGVPIEITANNIRVLR